MKIAFFSEANFTNKIPRSYRNMRTEYAWYVAANADHHCLFDLSSLQNSYDIGIVILPKKKIEHLPNDLFSILKNKCKKVGMMQEGPNWYWQDYDIKIQIKYINYLNDWDFILCHNKKDINYYMAYAKNKLKVFVMPTLMIVDNLNFSPNKKNIAMIGGNYCSWYSGFDSWIVYNSIDNVDNFMKPAMYYMKPEEKLVNDGITLDYLNWQDWMEQLSECKYGIHMMKTFAAGTFALNCAYLGIPCIGYDYLDTQRLCHPNTTVSICDVNSAQNIANRLSNDSTFYKLCSKTARQAWKKNFDENTWRNKMKVTFEKILK